MAAPSLPGIVAAAPGATDPYPPQHRAIFRAFCVLVGLAGGGALLWAAASGAPGYALTPELVLRGLLFVALGIGSSYFRFRIGQGTYSSIADIALLSAVMSLGPTAAGLVAALVQIWVELLITRRGPFFMARTVGMFTLMYLAGGGVYLAYVQVRGAQIPGLTIPLQSSGYTHWAGSGPAAFIGLLLAYIGIRVVNDLIMIVSRRFYGETPLGYLRATLSFNTLIDGAQLPLAILTALAYTSFNTLAFALWIALVILVANLLKRLADTRILLEQRVTELARTAAALRAEQAGKVRLEHDLTSTSSNLRGVAEAQATSLAGQASAVTQVSVTVEELSQSARQIAAAADAVAQAARQALEVASSGQTAVSNNLESMTRIQEQVAAITSSMEELHARAGRVSQIVGLISEIADETHLLALNATIEAAGAGLQGRRFAVVAAEVNNLAERALGAARDVQEILREIQQANTAALTATRRGTEQVSQGVALSRQSGQAHYAIIEMVKQANDLAHSISLATQQQRSASEQVALTMHQIADSVRASAASSQEISSSATVLNRLADELGHGNGAHPRG